MAVAINWRCFLVGVLSINALLFGVYIKGPNGSWHIPISLMSLMQPTI